MEPVEQIEPPEPINMDDELFFPLTMEAQMNLGGIKDHQLAAMIEALARKYNQLLEYVTQAAR